MSRPTDKPMARAQAHLAEGRYSEAIGAFRAVLGIDPSVLAARLGLADALAARGQRSVAVDGLVEAAERCAEQEQHEPALSLYGKALALDPARMELHLDVAVVEQAMGRTSAAVARVEGLAERYMTEGRTEEAAELLRFAASWEEGQASEAVEELEAVEAIEEFEEATVVARNPLLLARPVKPAAPVQTETVVCATVLVRPDGTLWFGNAASSGVPEIDESELTVARAVSAPIVLDEPNEFDDPDMVTRVASSTAHASDDMLTHAKTVVSASRPSASSRRPAASRTASVEPKVAAAVSRPSGPPPAPGAKPIVAQGAATKTIGSPRTAAKSVGQRPMAKPIVAQSATVKPSVAQSSAARPVVAQSAAVNERLRVDRAPRPGTAPAARPVAGASARPQASSRPSAQPPALRRPAAVEPASSFAGAAATGSSAIVDRLRKRAGLGPEVTAVPHGTKGKATEPIVIRRPNLGRPEEEVTSRFRHLRAASH